MHRRLIQRVGAQAVDCLGWKHHQLAAQQRLSGLPNGGRVGRGGVNMDDYRS
jgi:hypothetical protein